MAEGGQAPKPVPNDNSKKQNGFNPAPGGLRWELKLVPCPSLGFGHPTQDGEQGPVEAEFPSSCCSRGQGVRWHRPGWVSGCPCHLPAGVLSVHRAQEYSTHGWPHGWRHSCLCCAPRSPCPLGLRVPHFQPYFPLLGAKALSFLRTRRQGGGRPGSQRGERRKPVCPTGCSSLPADRPPTCPHLWDQRWATPGASEQ